MKAQELQAMRDMMQLHDELLEVVTVRQFERALEYTMNEIKVGRARHLKEFT
jgi:hypothetical protein